MARPLRIQYRDAYYHVTCRGNDRRSIYRDDSDRELFLEKLKGSLEIYGVALHAYVLMGNHFHLLVQTPKANLSEFMRHFNIAYTGAYNRRHKRVGHLYQGRYHNVVVNGEDQFLMLCRYVESNALRAGLVERAEMWPYCSLSRITTREGKPLLSDWPLARPENWLEIVNGTHCRD